MTNVASLERGQQGYAYLALLGFVAVAGIGLAVLAQVWSTASQRERERELLFIGQQYRKAIASYYDESPGAKQYPRSLDDLLDDKRFPTPTRHLRRLYLDPMSGSSEWGLVLHQEWIIGVYSLSEARPIKTAQFSPQDAAFVDAEHYTDWRFVHKLEGVQAAGSAQAIGAAQANTTRVSASGELVLQSTGTPPPHGRTRPLAPTAP
jgi:type II secretory pathway pseudopilin PulG